MKKSEHVLLMLLVLLVTAATFVFFGLELHRLAVHATVNLNPLRQ